MHINVSNSNMHHIGKSIRACTSSHEISKHSLCNCSCAGYEFPVKDDELKYTIYEGVLKSSVNKNLFHGFVLKKINAIGMLINLEDILQKIQ